MGNISWYAIIAMIMLAGGGVFFAAGEPITHFMTLPAHFSGIESATSEAVPYALAQSYFDWGFLVWGAASFCVPLLLYAKEMKSLPMRPSSMLYPVLGDKGVNGWPGKLLDGLALIGVAAGTIGPTGFLGLQIAFALDNIWGIPNTVTTQVVVILISGIMFTLGAATGLKKGIDWLPKATLYLSVVFAVCMFLFGMGLFMWDSYIDSLGVYIQEFFRMAFSRTDTTWIGSWTVFYEAWFLSFGPSMGVLILSLSKGRSLRQVILSIAIVCPLITNFWFAVFGGNAIGFELSSPGMISDVLNTAGMPGVLITMLQNMNFKIVMIPLALILIALFLVTTGAGVAYSMSVQVTDMEVPYRWIRILFSVLLAVVAAVLVWIGADDAMNTIQNFMVIGGVPLLVFYCILIPAVKKAAAALYNDPEHRIEEVDELRPAGNKREKEAFK